MNDLTVLLLLFLGSGLLLAGLSIPLILKRIPPNGLYGFRVAKTMGNPEIWYPANAYAGKCLLACAIGEIASAVGLYFWPGISVDGYALALAFILLWLPTITLIKSFRYLQSL